MSIVTKMTFIYNNRLTLGLIGTMFNVSRGVLEATFLAIDKSFFTTPSITTLETTVLAIDRLFLHQELPTTIDQIPYRKAMSSGGGGIDSGGIQDIAGIPPLLGTEQCSIHVSSALTRGCLHAVSAPMSIFSNFRGGQRRWIQDIGWLFLERYLVSQQRISSF